MTNFSEILKHGQKRFKVKDGTGEWGSCDYCDNRRVLFKYVDSKNEFWFLCNECTNIFIEEDE